MNKYNARKVEIDGYVFDSQKEARRYSELKLLEHDRQIAQLEVHKVYKLVINGVLICKYEADFVYIDTRTLELVTEDVKGYKTAVYRLKKKLMKAIHGIEITEI